MIGSFFLIIELGKERSITTCATKHKINTPTPGVKIRFCGPWEGIIKIYTTDMGHWYKKIGTAGR